MRIQGAWTSHFLQTPTQIWMRAVAFAQLVMLFVCIFLYRFGPPTPLLHSRNCASLWKHLLKSGRKPKKGWERNLFLFSSLFEKQKSTTPLLSSLSRVTCIISFSIQYPPIILDLLSLSLSLSLSEVQEYGPAIKWLLCLNWKKLTVLELVEEKRFG